MSIVAIMQIKDHGNGNGLSAVVFSFHTPKIAVFKYIFFKSFFRDHRAHIYLHNVTCTMPRHSHLY